MFHDTRWIRLRPNGPLTKLDIDLRTLENGVHYANEIKDVALLRLTSSIRKQIDKLRIAVQESIVDAARLWYTGEITEDVLNYALANGVLVAKYIPGA